MNGLLYVYILVLSVIVGCTQGDTVDDQYKELMERVIQLERKIEKQGVLEARVEHLETLVSVQKRQLKVQQREISQLRKQRKSDVDKAFQQDKGIEETTEEVPGQNIDTTAPVRRIRVAPEMSVAFTVLLDHETRHMAIDQTLIFNKALLNDGNAYNIHTGVFTVPREGLYMFYFTFGLGYDSSQLWLRIVVDGKQKVAGVADTLQANHDAQGGNMVMLHLYPGDSVWVNVFYYNDVHVYGTHGFTSFSGVLLYEYMY